jgi:hypothetical protein
MNQNNAVVPDPSRRITRRTAQRLAPGQVQFAELGVEPTSRRTGRAGARNDRVPAANQRDHQAAPEFAQAATADIGSSASVAANREVWPMAYSSFHELYSDAAKDPWKGDYTRIMRRFDTNVDEPLDGRDLSEKVVRLRPDYPQSYLMCFHTANGTRIFCVHTPSQYQEELDGTNTPWDQLGFAFLGDVFQGSITTVYFPNRAFDILEPVAARVAQRLTADLSQLQGATVLEPLEEGDLATTMVVTRRFMHLPYCFVTRFLDAKGYTVAEAWHLLIDDQSEEDILEDCQPLLDWLRVSAQATVDEDGRLKTPLTSTALQAPLAD